MPRVPPGAEASGTQRSGSTVPLGSQSRRSPACTSFQIHALDAVYVVPWSEFPIVPSCPHYPQEGGPHLVS